MYTLWNIELIFQLNNAMDYFTLPQTIKDLLADQETPFFLFDLDIIKSKIDQKYFTFGSKNQIDNLKANAPGSNNGDNIPKVFFINNGIVMA